jgi:ParB family chromosome partitioning protein
VDESLDSLLGLDGQPPTGRAVAGGERDAGGLRSIPLDAIRPSSLQPRDEFAEDELAALAASVAELGVLQPVLVRQVTADEYELIAGERRWRAARRAGLAVIPAIVRDVSDRESLEQAVVENVQRADLNVLEEAAAYRQLIDEFGLTQDRVGQRVGRSRSAVANTLRLLHLPAGVQRLIVSGDLSAGHARALLAFPDPVVQAELARRVVRDGLSVRDVEELVRAASQKAGSMADERPGPAGATKPAALLEIEELLAERLETRVTVTLGRTRGRLLVEFADLDDLDRIYRLLANEQD